jgi:hypothetical protein
MEYSIKIIVENEEGKRLESEKVIESDDGLFINLEIIKFEDISGILFNPKHLISITRKIQIYICSCLGNFIDEKEHVAETIKSD